MKISDIVRHKGDSVVTVRSDATVKDLLALLAEHKIGAIVVSDSDGSVDGIVSERDYVRKLAELERAAFDARVADIMTAEVITVGPRDSVQHCLQMMTDHRLRHLPVVAEGELIGMLSIGDLVKQTIDDQASLIQQLEQYIRGG